MISAIVTKVKFKIQCSTHGCRQHAVQAVVDQGGFDPNNPKLLEGISLYFQAKGWDCSSDATSAKCPYCKRQDA